MHLQFIEISSRNASPPFAFSGLEITPHIDNGLVFYFGPMTYSPKIKIQDFMALELQQGYAVLYMDYGSGTVRLDQPHIKLTDGKSHRIDVYFTKNVSIIGATFSQSFFYSVIFFPSFFYPFILNLCCNSSFQ